MRMIAQRGRKQVRLPQLAARPSKTRRQSRWRRWIAGSFLLGAAVGAALAYALDREQGRRRRHIAHDRVGGVSHRLARRAGRKLHVTVAQALGHSQGLAHRLRPGPVEELDDVALAHKVESIVFRDPRVPKGQISVNAESGLVFLRGQVEPPDLVADLENAVRKIRGVREVENLLHAPGTPAPRPRAGARRPAR